MKIKKDYTFTGFGFDVVIPKVMLRSVAGETYPDVNMNELKILTAKALVRSESRLLGGHLSFLRTFMDFSLVTFGEMIDVSPSTISLWESKLDRATGLNDAQERLIRMIVLNFILEKERDYYSKKVVLTEKYLDQSKAKIEL